MDKIKKQEKFLKISIILLICFTVLFIGILLGYKFLTPESKNNLDSKNNSLNSGEMPELNSEEEIKDALKNQNKTNDAKINAETTMTYEYFNVEASYTEKSNEKAPYFIINMDEEKLKDTFPDWDVISFNSNEVVMRKTIEKESSSQYVISGEDGFVAVFYKNPVDDNVLKEITTMPLSALTDEDRLRLKEGVYITGDDALIKALEDFTS